MINNRPIPIIKNLKYGTLSIKCNLNDLIKNREEEKQVDKKNNIIIVSGLAAVIGLVVIIVSL